MNKLMEIAAAAALIMGGTQTATAQNWNGAEQIARGDYRAAERVIVAQRRQFPLDVDLTLNLARVYAATGRSAEAQQLYRMVATQPNAEMDMPRGEVAWSRDLAVRGSRSLAGATVAAR